MFDKLTKLTTLNLTNNSALSCLPFIPSSVTDLKLSKDKSAFSACGAGVTVGSTGVSAGPGSTAIYTVVLDAHPTGNVTVTPASSAAGTATVSGALTFAQGNWSTSQTVTVTGVAVGSATVSHTVAGGGYGSATAADVAVTVANQAPSAPTSLTATSGDASVALSWTSGGNGGSPITKWEYARKEGNNAFGSWTDICVTSGNAGCPSTTSHTLTGLTNGTAYTFKVRAVNAIGNGAAAESSAVSPSSVCGRTPEVRDAIVAAVAGKSTCGAIADTDLAGISTLGIFGKTSLTALKAGDFAGLTGLTNLALNNNSLGSLPAGVFDALTSLQQLDLYNTDGDGGSFSGLPAGVFDKLTSLQKLDVGSLGLSSLSAGVFDKLTELTELKLYWNSLGSLPVGVFDKLTKLKTLSLTNNPALSCLPFIPSSVTTLQLSKDKSAFSACGAGVTVGSTGVSVGPGSNATYTVVLDAWPTGDVTVTPESSATSTATVSGALTFAQGNWSTSQTVTVTGVAVGSATVSHTVAGGGYGSATAADVTVTVTGQPSLAAGNIAATSATLTIANHSGAWYWKYTVPGGGSCSTQEVPAGTSSKTVTGLESNTSYTFKAYSNGACSTELATAAAFPTKPPKPAKPTMAIGNTELTLSSSVSGGSVALTGWQYISKVGTGSFGTSWTPIDKTSKTLSHTFTGLTNDTDYSFKVRAVNASGWGEESEASQAMAPTDATLTAESITATGATLTLSSLPGNITTWYYQYTSPGGGSCKSATGTTASVTGLEKDTEYRFEIYSDATCSTSLGLVVSFTTLERDPPDVTPPDGSGTPLAPSKPVGDGRRPAGHAELDLQRRRRLPHHEVAVREAGGRRRLRDRLDRHPRQRRGHHDVHRHGPDQRDRLPVQGAGGERRRRGRRLARIRPGDAVGGDHGNGPPGAGPADGGRWRRTGHAGVDLRRRRRLADHEVAVRQEGGRQRLRDDMDGHSGQQRAHHDVHRHGPRQRRRVPFQGARGQRHRRRRRIAGVRSGDAGRSASGAGPADGGGWRRAGDAGVDLRRQRRLADHEVAVRQEGGRRRLRDDVDGHSGQRRAHPTLHRDGPDQRHCVPVQGARGQRGRQRRRVARVGRGDAGRGGGARAAHPGERDARAGVRAGDGVERGRCGEDALRARGVGVGGDGGGAGVAGVRRPGVGRAERGARGGDHHLARGAGRRVVRAVAGRERRERRRTASAVRAAWAV